MRRYIALVTIFTFLLTTFCATVKPYQVTNYFRSTKIEERQIKRVAVLSFENLTDQPAAAGIVTDEFTLQLGKLGIFDLVERARIEELFKEQDVDTIRFDRATIAKIGKMLGAQGVFLGSATKFLPYPTARVDTAKYRYYEHYRPQVIIIDRPYRDTTECRNWKCPDGHTWRCTSSECPICGKEGTPYTKRDTTEAMNWRTVAICCAATITVGGLIYLIYRLVKPKPPSAEVGLSVRLVDVETGEYLWQAKETFRGDRKSIQALAESKEDKPRLVSDIEYLTQILCREVVKTIVK